MRTLSYQELQSRVEYSHGAQIEILRRVIADELPTEDDIYAIEIDNEEADSEAYDRGYEVGLEEGENK